MNLVCLVLALLSTQLMAQVTEQNEFNIYQSPAGENWKSIENSEFKIIYLDGQKSQADRVLSTLNKIQTPDRENLSAPHKKIDILLRPHTVISNGFVTLAPRRSEWMLTPMMDTDVGAGYWTDLLAIHEYRHVVQFDYLFRGFNKGMYYFLGETGWSFASVWNTPNWFFEGDAVTMETALTSFGRGRSPEFISRMKAFVMEAESVNLDQAILQSYKRYVPNHYELGYFYVSFLKQKFGAKIFEQILNETTMRGYNPYAFYNAIKTITGVGAEDLYSEMIKTLKAGWQAELDKITVREDDAIVTPNSPTWTNYQFLYPYEDKKIAYKTGFNSVGELVGLDADGDESHLMTTGTITAGGPRYCQDKVVWSELDFHYRWGLKDYSVLRLYDLKRNKSTYLTSRSRYFSPNFSPDCQKVIAVEFSEDQKFSLAIIDLKTEEVIKKIPSENNELIMHPVWVNNKIIAVKKDNQLGQLRLSSIDTESGSEELLIKPGFELISHPFYAEGKVYYRSSISGVDNIFSLDLNSQKISQLTQSPYGAHIPSVVGQKLYYSDYHAGGFKPVSVDLDKMTPITTNPQATLWSKEVVATEGQSDILSQPTPTLVETLEENYSLAKQSLNPHSWFIFAWPFDPVIVTQIQSTDLFNTFNVYGGLTYSYVEKTNSQFMGVNWTYWYPIFFVNVENAQRSINQGTDENPIYVPWKELQLETGFTLPLNLSSGAYDRKMTLTPSFELIRVDDRPVPFTNDLNDNTLHGYNLSFHFDTLRKLATRDINPRWGISFDALSKRGKVPRTAAHTFGAELFSTQVQLYLPGLFNHHSLSFFAAYEKQDNYNYQYASEFTFTRGYDAVYFPEYNKYSADYLLPVVYPDFRIWDYVYFRRIALDFFYDYLLARSATDRQLFNSYGVEVLFETSLLRNMNFTFNWGVRYSQRVRDDQGDVGLFLRTNF
ncbi:MAG: hypothetical protein JNM93_14020 [Bacteriovoracaceae bacterium]|nr:hypothetical protein [Bacteriovoracaceae bacterium]